MHVISHLVIVKTARSLPLWELRCIQEMGESAYSKYDSTNHNSFFLLLLVFFKLMANVRLFCISKECYITITSLISLPLTLNLLLESGKKGIYTLSTEICAVLVCAILAAIIPRYFGWLPVCWKVVSIVFWLFVYVKRAHLHISYSGMCKCFCQNHSL